jgi:hypothetical protein
MITMFYLFEYLETFGTRGEYNLRVTGFNLPVKQFKTTISLVKFPLEHVWCTAACSHPTKNCIRAAEMIEQTKRLPHRPCGIQIAAWVEEYVRFLFRSRLHETDKISVYYLLSYDIYPLCDSFDAGQFRSLDEKIPRITPGFLVSYFKFKIPNHEIPTDVHRADRHTFPALRAMEHELPDFRRHFSTVL